MEQEKMMVPYKKKEDCCGCSACAAICPLDAIRMMLDEDGYYYPQINYISCVSCGLCKEVCEFSKND